MNISVTKEIVDSIRSKSIGDQTSYLLDVLDSNIDISNKDIKELMRVFTPLLLVLKVGNKVVGNGNSSEEWKQLRVQYVVDNYK